MSDPTTWVEISTAALAENLERVRAHAGVPVCAVVKGNGYGHGLTIAARAFVRAGAAMLGVTRMEEARVLRDAGMDAPVLVLTPVLDPAEAMKLRLEVTVGSAEDIAMLPSGARAHLKIDTGMGRLGVRPADALEAARAISSRAILASVWTHLADAAAAGTEPLERFRSVVGSLRAAGIAAPAHAANSAAVVALADARLDMVRVGTILYGLEPPGVRVPWPTRSAMSWFARVVSVRTIPVGATVGYGSEWRAKAPTRAATLPIGYADGFTLEPAARTETFAEASRAAARIGAVALGRRPSSRAVWFGDRRAPVLGRVGMQAITVAVGPDVSVGAVARIPARRLVVSPLIERIEV